MSEPINKNHILIVDNEDDTRKQAEKLLLSFDFKVTSVKSVAEAKAILKDQSVDMVVSELQIPAESGLDLAQWIRRVYDSSFKNKRRLPFLLLTSFTHFMEQEDLDNHHIDHCLLKPIDEDYFVDTIKDVLNPTRKKRKDNQGEDEKAKREEVLKVQRQYCKIGIGDVSSFKNLHFDLYMKISDNHFIKVGREGGQLNENQFERYHEKGTKFLYIKRGQFRKLVELNLKMAKVAVKSDLLSPDKKRKFLLKTGEIVLESTFVNGLNPDTFEDAKSYLMTSLNTLLTTKDSFKLLEMLNDHSDHLYAHSLGVSLYSVMVAQNMGWNSGNNLFKLSFGALIHDIGKKDFDPELLKKARKDMTPEELELIKTHPERGRKILEDLKTVPSEVIAIAHEHHENAMGTGYPRQLTKARINPMARIVGVADEFCFYAIKNPDYPDVNASLALDVLSRCKTEIVADEAFHALERVIKTPRQKVS